jgi:hypothetical protein
MPEAGFPDAINVCEAAMKATAGSCADAKDLLAKDCEHHLCCHLELEKERQRFFFAAEYYTILVAPCDRTLNKTETLGYFDYMKSIGFSQIKPLEPVHTPTLTSAWTLVSTEFGPSLPSDIKQIEPHVFWIKTEGGKIKRIVQVLNSVDAYQRTAKFLIHALQAQAGTGA